MAANRRIEFGDFQTPESLARDVCRVLRRSRLKPASIFEPTCGIGNLVVAAFEAFPSATAGFAADLNADYVAATRGRLRTQLAAVQIDVMQANFFQTDWNGHLATLPDPLLAIGNPPWVNNSQLGAIGGKNLPHKDNAVKLRGIEAITGKSNFDVSEWMLNALIDILAGRRATLAMLCKTAVARKVLARTWSERRKVNSARMYLIDSLKSFGASVDACLLVCRFGRRAIQPTCDVFSSFSAGRPLQQFGFRDGRLIADTDLYEKWRHLRATSPVRWRSGIKHDCAKVMELRRHGSRFTNGWGEVVALEDKFVFPLLKSSQVAAGKTSQTDRWMLVPQQRVGDDTAPIRQQAPRTWSYLQSHGKCLDRRASSIYRNRPRFSVFGVGDYTFAPWKVAVSGLYKKLVFRKLGPYDGKPMVLDDTAYFIACRDEAEADRVASMLNNGPSHEFLSSLLFWDAKRPITAATLGLLDLAQAGLGSSS
ncbi:MAG: hypothetical protein QGG71_11780 [Pirellulaceae bacterium]|nr:hypothetical protein [Pirellulaceae bacterium]